MLDALEAVAIFFSKAKPLQLRVLFLFLFLEPFALCVGARVRHGSVELDLLLALSLIHDCRLVELPTLLEPLLQLVELALPGRHVCHERKGVRLVINILLPLSCLALSAGGCGLHLGPPRATQPCIACFPISVRLLGSPLRCLLGLDLCELVLRRPDRRPELLWLLLHHCESLKALSRLLVGVEGDRILTIFFELFLLLELLLELRLAALELRRRISAAI